MDIIKKIFPLSFNRENTTKDTVIGVAIYLAVSILSDIILIVLRHFLGHIPGMKFVINIVAALLGAYGAAGIVLIFLRKLELLG